ncbi:hypothetical protein SAMN04487783_1669 [Agrococcus baldri]|uniref:Uncharacterized protein n=1 Tax=Agrococcus baldri TaxID=153730 RepID=A0AA94HMU4_9MICO|nr:hypothetical protein [Agrococcus baldri]SFS12080.1 hypothetical protein SAMN04487783_1669 [Agrococcus baldri]
MTGWLTASFRAHAVLLLGCAVLLVLALVGAEPDGIDSTALGLLATGVLRFPATGPVLVPLLAASAVVIGQAIALVAATRGRVEGRWALLTIAGVTAISRIIGAIATGDVLLALVLSAVWLLLAGVLFLPSSDDWFDAREPQR